MPTHNYAQLRASITGKIVDFYMSSPLFQSTSICITMDIDELVRLLNFIRYFGTESKVPGSAIVTRIAAPRYRQWGKLHRPCAGAYVPECAYAILF